MNPSRQQLIDLISEDNLRDALELLLQLCVENKSQQGLELEIRSVMGRLNRLESDRVTGIIPLNQYYENLNQIRANILSIVQKSNNPIEARKGNSNQLSSLLHKEIHTSEKLLQQNRKLDLVFKILLFSVLLAGLGIFVFSISFKNQGFLGSLSILAISSALYCYTRLRGVEIMTHRYNQSF